MKLGGFGSFQKYVKSIRLRPFKNIYMPGDKFQKYVKSIRLRPCSLATQPVFQFQKYVKSIRLRMVLSLVRMT